MTIDDLVEIPPRTYREAIAKRVFWTPLGVIFADSAMQAAIVADNNHMFDGLAVEQLEVDYYLAVTRKGQ